MYLPLMLNLIGRKIVIIGGGSVALKKAQKIRDYGGDVKVVSLHFIDAFEALENVETIQAYYEEHHIRDAWLVIAATSDSALNKQIYKDCKRDRVLCNVVDDANLSDVIFPASFRQGELTISVSTGGNSPLLAKEILRTVEALYDDSVKKRIELIGEIRRYLIETETDPMTKQHQLEAILQQSTKDLEAYREKMKRGHCQ